MIKDIKDNYNHQFIDDEKMEMCVRDVLIALEQNKLRMMEKEIVLDQAKYFLKQKQQNLNDQSILTDQVDKFGRMMNKLK